MVAPKVAKHKKRKAGAAKRAEREILPKPGLRGWRDRGPFRSVSSMANRLRGTPPCRRVTGKRRHGENIFSSGCLDANPWCGEILSGRNGVFGVLSLLFAGDREGGGIDNEQRNAREAWGRETRSGKCGGWHWR